LEDESTFPGLSHALKFVKIMEELVRTNKQLKAEWISRRISILGSIKDLLLEGMCRPRHLSFRSPDVIQNKASTILKA
jgi:hypothetical protein